MTPNEIATNISGTAAGMGNIAMASFNNTFTTTTSGGQVIPRTDDQNQWDR